MDCDRWESKELAVRTKYHDIGNSVGDHTVIIPTSYEQPEAQSTACEYLLTYVNMYVCMYACMYIIKHVLVRVWMFVCTQYIREHMHVIIIVVTIIVQFAGFYASCRIAVTLRIEKSAEE